MQRRPKTSVGTGEPSPSELQAMKKFNANLRYVQGYKTTILANSTQNQTIALNSAGKMFLGFALIPSTKTIPINDVQITLIINNNNVVLNMSASNACPIDVQGMIFFPCPQNLSGNDTITMVYTNNSAVAVTIINDVFYVPQ